jgi:hypothetical protein
MGIKVMLRRILLVVAFIGSTCGVGFAQTETVVVRPVETDEVLVNPGMGITTFQRFNGQALTAGRWSEEGPISKLESAPAKPDFPGTSIAYCRWFWSQIEPAPGQFRWEIIDTALAEARLHNQTLAIRLMPYDPDHPLPEWYRNSGARRANKPADKDGKIWQPDFSDPLYLKYWSRVVQAAGTRYDGHPFLESVDISSVGYWGEGWSNYMPAFTNQQALIDIYFDAFKQTPLLMNFDEPQALSYGTQKGAGWRLDCLGDMGREWKDRPSFSHMLDFYPQQVARTGIQNVWQRSPVSLETCWVPAFWKEKNWDVDYILEQALRWHVSSLNVKSSAIPPEWKGKFDEFQKRMGYRFILRRFEYPKTVRPGQMMSIKSWWLNKGVAPIYRDYTLALEFNSPDGSEIVRLPVDARSWLPGDAIYDGQIYVPDQLKPGRYQLRLALLDPRTGVPAVRLAIRGRDAEGWYKLDFINVSEQR